MDISGLTSVTTPAQMLTWLADNCMTPINPGMSGSDFGAIMQKIISVSSISSDQQIITYLQNLPGYVGDGSKVLGDDLTWQGSGDTVLGAPTLILGEITSSSIALSWNSIPDAEIYVVQRALNNAFTNTPVNIYIGADLGYVNTGLTSGSQYFYRIKAVALGFTDSSWSTAVNGITNSKTANMVVGENLNPVVDGWNTISSNSLGTPVSLLNNSGAPLGWTVNAATTGTVTFETIDSQNTVPDFPDAICDQQWYGDPAGTLSFNISGLDNSKTYTIKTCHADSGFIGNGTTIVNCNGSATQSGDPDNLTFVLEFNNISPESGGNILVSMTSTDGAPVINAMIVAEQ